MTAALYIKELKDVRGVFCLLAIGTVVLQGWVLLTIETHAIAVFFSSLPVWAALFVPPVLLASSFNGEWRDNTIHLLFALPVRTGVVSLCKYAAILSAGLVLSGIAGTGLYFVALRAPWEAVSAILRFFGVTPTEAIGSTAGVVASFLLLSLGVVTAMEGAKYTVGRLRGLTAAVSFVSCIVVYLTLAGYFVGALQAFLPTGAALMAYTILAGLVYLLAGILLFEKFVEI
jgi:ABC-type transport system involved in multi-copper enzyme maturation permease subunit